MQAFRLDGYRLAVLVPVGAETPLDTFVSFNAPRATLAWSRLDPLDEEHALQVFNQTLNAPGRVSPTPTGPQFAPVIHAGLDLVRENMRRSLASWRFERQVDLIIDLPLGFALQTVPELANPAVVVTSCEAAGYLNDLQRLEPSAIIVNPESTVNLRKPLQSVAEGQRVYVGPSLPDLQLMPREWEVWQRVATGADNDGIATALGVTRKTVANYVTNLQEKLGVRGRTGLMLTYWGHPATG